MITRDHIANVHPKQSDFEQHVRMQQQLGLIYFGPPLDHRGYILLDEEQEGLVGIYRFRDTPAWEPTTTGRLLALHLYYEACWGIIDAERAADETNDLYYLRSAMDRALDEEHASTEEAIREGITLPELDAMAAIAGSRFAPQWARKAYGAPS